MDFYLLSVVIFILVISILVYRDRKKIVRESLFLIRRTNRGRDSLVRLGERFPWFWRVLGTIGVAVGFYVSIETLLNLINLTIANISAAGKLPGVGLLLPLPTSQTIIVPGIIAMPFWYWIIAIAILMVVHEGSHGIMAAMEKIKIKTLGLVLFIIIPGAFVELDEKQLRAERPIKQLRVYAAGSFANFIVALIAVLLGTILVSSFFVPSGVGFVGVYEGYPAEKANMTGIIYQIDNYSIRNISDLDFALTEIGPNKTITVLTRNSTENMSFVLKTADHPENLTKGFIGIAKTTTSMSIAENFTDFAGLIEFFRSLLFFIFLINFGIGAFNLLPLWITDGARMWEIVFQKVARKRSKALLKAFSYFVLLLILFNLSLSLGSGLI